VSADPFDLIVLPMTAHVIWTALLYAALTVARAPRVWGIGRAPDGANPLDYLESRVSSNLRNQFEWPLLFYAVCILGLIEGSAVGPRFALVAWIFVAGRIAHSVIQILTENVRLRGVVFTVNFVAVLWLWGLLFV